MAGLLANRIAKCAIDHYDRIIPSNNGGKPQLGREWTVYAAIVACRRRSGGVGDGYCCTEQDSEMWVVSCATGSKCTSIRSVVSSLPKASSSNDILRTNNSTEHGTPSNQSLDMDEDSICCYKGMIIKDSHAEILARRGLMSYLWDEIEHYSLQNTKSSSSDYLHVHASKDKTKNLLEDYKNDDGSLAFRIKSAISLHMYVSDSPCGDAAIYEVRKVVNGHEKETELNFTGAKIILPDGENQSTKNDFISSVITCSVAQNPNDGDTKQSAITLGREDVQQLGKLRLKSSRSNIPPEQRSRSMSCSDKIVRWGVLGMQGALLSTYIPRPICLSSICVSKDPRSADGGTCSGQLAALERALPKRIETALRSTKETHEKIKPLDVAVVDTIFQSSKSASDKRYFEAINERKRKNVNQIMGPDESKRHKTQTQWSSKNETQRRMQSQHRNANTSGTDQVIKKESACGMSINWQRTCFTKVKEDGKTTEVTIGATGLKRGKKPKRSEDVLRSASRLCRFNLLQRCMRCKEIKSEGESETLKSDGSDMSVAQTSQKITYMQYKQQYGTNYAGTEFFRGWIRSGKDEDFMLPPP